MRNGLTLPNAGPAADPGFLAELAAIAEAAGWDGVFLEDYIVHHEGPAVPTGDPWIALAAMAVRTTRIRLGTSVTPLPRRRPWKVARETVGIDQLSHGRMVLGVGLGDLGDPGFGAVGEAIGTRERAARLDEALAIITGLWRGEPFNFHGRHFTVTNLTCRPGPVQQPRVPIWVGGNWPHLGPLRRAARWDGFNGGKDHAPDAPWRFTPDELRAVIRTIRANRTTAAPFEVVTGGAVRDPDAAAERDARRGLAAAGATWWMEYVPVADADTMRAGVARGPLALE